MIVKPATKEILDKFLGTYPSMKAVVAMEGDECLGVAGVHLYEGKYIVFSNISEDLRKRKDFKRIVVKSYRILLNLLKTTKLPVYAKACPFIDGSEVLLKHMGFKRAYENIYIWPRY